MLLELSVLFVVIAVCIGIYMVMNMVQRKPRYPSWVPLAHMGTIGIGAVLVCWVALSTYDIRLWSNIAVAVVVTLLDFAVSHGKMPGSKRKQLLAAHAIIAIFFAPYSLFLMPLWCKHMAAFIR